MKDAERERAGEAMVFWFSFSPHERDLRRHGYGVSKSQHNQHGSAKISGMQTASNALGGGMLQVWVQTFEMFIRVALCVCSEYCGWEDHCLAALDSVGLCVFGVVSVRDRKSVV